MIICHCNILTRSEIESAIAELLADDPWIQLTPVRVYHALQKRGQCCGCFPVVANLIVEVADALRDTGRLGVTVSQDTEPSIQKAS